MSCDGHFMKRASFDNDNFSQPEPKYQKPESREFTPHAFPTQPRERFNKPFPYFRMPEENGCFSQDSERRFCADKSQMRFYVRPVDAKNVHFDLTHGYEDFIKKDENKKQYLDDMLKWVMENSAKFQLQTKPSKGIDNEPKPHNIITSLHTDFVCWRGLLTRLLCTPYENRDNWMVAVTLFRGTYFLCEFETESKKRDRENRPRRQEEMCYWGFKFEQYLTADVPGGVPDTLVPVNNKQGFCSVVRTRLNKHSLVFGGEVDCVDPTLGSKNKYVELKTTREMTTQRQKDNFIRYKLIKWWAQSFLIGIDQIIGGMRDDDGVVHRLEDYHTHKIPEMAKGIPDSWNPAICFNFLDKFLDFIKNTVTTDDPRVTYVCRWEPGQEVACQQMQQDSEFVFLPDWFLNWEAWG